MTVYLIHLSQPLPRGTSAKGKELQASHYIGFANDLNGRMKHHQNGTGARFTQVCVERGIPFQLARSWDGKGRDFERQLKNQKKAHDLCPICNPDAMRRMKE